jgi:ketosteroid isomerase-like protein
VTAQNIAVVRRLYEAWSRHEFPGPIELLDPEIEYVNPAGAIEPGTRRGISEFTRAAQKLFDAWEFWRGDPTQLEAVGDHVVAVVRYRARGRGSGVEVEGSESALFTLRDGKVIRYEWFHGAADAFEAPALREHRAQ